MERLYRIEYQIIDQSITLFSNDEVVERAKFAFRGWNDANRNYNLLTNNCEHFATWCKCAIYVSFQVEELDKTYGLSIPMARVINAVGGPFGLALAAGMLAVKSSLAKKGNSIEHFVEVFKELK